MKATKRRIKKNRNGCTTTECHLSFTDGLDQVVRELDCLLNIDTKQGNTKLIISINEEYICINIYIFICLSIADICPI